MQNEQLKQCAIQLLNIAISRSSGIKMLRNDFEEILESVQANGTAWSPEEWEAWIEDQFNGFYTEFPEEEE